MPACGSDQTSLVDALNSVGVTDITDEYLMKLAMANGIEDYAYTEEQDQAMLELLKAGTLAEPVDVVLNGWYDMNGVRCYYENGTKKTGWLTLDDGKYYLNEEGAMQTGWITVNNKTYYLKSNGAMVTGTYTIDGVTYEFDSSGALIS